MQNNNKGDTLLNIQAHMKALTKSEKLVAQYILEHANEVIYLSITDISDIVRVGESTIIRFCRKLGFRGFQDFKLALAQDLVNFVEQEEYNIDNNDSIESFSKKIINSYNNVLEGTLKLINPLKYKLAIELLSNAENIYIFGVGSSGLIAKLAANSFARIGKRCITNSDTHFQALFASLMTERDVAIGISVSGSTKDTLKNLELAKSNRAKIICITHNARSPITQLADVELIMHARENPLQGSSLSSKISQLAVIDILYTGLMIKQEQKSKYYLEKTAKAVTDKLL